MQRINVIGTTGTGKSTFSKKLAEIIQAPYVEIDKVFWRPNWTYLNDEQLFKNLEVELNTEKWVLDGNYTHTTPVKWKNVQTVIWLDFPFLTVLMSSVKRAIYRSTSGIELWPGTGNRESFKMLFGSDSIVLWTLKTFRKRKKEYAAAMEDKNYAHIKFVRLKSPAEAENFLNALENENRMVA